MVCGSMSHTMACIYEFGTHMHAWFAPACLQALLGVWCVVCLFGMHHLQLQFTASQADRQGLLNTGHSIQFVFATPSTASLLQCSTL